MGNQEILLSTIFNESFDAMMILDLSTQKFIMFNKKTLEIYNYSEEEFKQITPKELTLEFVSDEKMKEKQKTILDRGWDKFTTKHKTKDGKAIDVLIKSKKIELIKDVPLLYITIHNLEKEKELEKEFETIFNNTKDGIATIDFEGKLLKFNNSFKLLSEYNYNELINLSFLDLIPHSNKRKIKEAIKEVIKNNFIENFETIYLTKNNKSIVIYMTMNLMPNQKQILLIVKNFTFIKLKELEKRFESLNQLVSNIGHQWRQPLNHISIIASNIKLQEELGVYDNSNLSKDMDKIVDISNELSTTINDFDLENINNYDKEYYLRDLINEIITILQKDLLENNIEVISQLNNEAKIYVDKNKFIQAIINILHNSIESFNKNKIVNRVIFIKLKQIDNDTQLEIKDNAGGIEESILSKIFEPYFTTNHQSQGKGLGLTNTYKIIVSIYKFLLSYSNCKITYKNKTYKGVCVTLTF